MGMLTKEQAKRVEEQMAKPLPGEWEMRKGGRKFVWYFIRFLMKVLYRVSVEHPERVPKSGPVLLCANHINYFDIPLIHLQLDRWVYWVARESLFRSRFSSWFLPWWGAMPIDVKNPEPSQIKKILASLKEEKLIGIFPQGTRCNTPEKLRETVPRNGVVSFAIRTGAAVVPVSIVGEFKLFRQTKIIVGEPFHYDLPKNHRHSAEELNTMTIELMEKIFRMKGEEYPLRNKEELTGGRLSDHVE